MSEQHSIQIQSVLYHNKVEMLVQALDNLANAIEVDRKTDRAVGQVTVCYGDASNRPTLTEKEVSEIAQSYEKHFQFRYTFFDENTGTSKGHNRLAQACDSEYMLIMNPDVVVNPHFFGQMLYPFEMDEKTGITEARQSPVEHHKDYDIETGETSWATTAAAIIPTTLYNKLHGFDEDTFFMYCDDLDFSWRVRLDGYKVIYVPAAVVFHAKQLGIRGEWQPTNAEKYYSAEAALLMAHKWSNPMRVKKLLSLFSNSDDEHLQKAAQAFLKRREEGKLPTPIDPHHLVASFIGDGFGESRFRMN